MVISVPDGNTERRKCHKGNPHNYSLPTVRIETKMWSLTESALMGNLSPSACSSHLPLVGLCRFGIEAAYVWGKRPLAMLTYADSFSKNEISSCRWTFINLSNKEPAFYESAENADMAHMPY